MQIVPGLYEALLTERMQDDLSNLPDSLKPLIDEVDAADAPHVLSRYLYDVLRRAMTSVSGTPEERIARQAELCNRLLTVLQDALKSDIRREKLLDSHKLIR